MTQTATKTMTPAQAIAARALASAYGHEWADGRVGVPLNMYNVEEIDAFVMAADVFHMHGITSPDMDDCAAIHHVTQTGRLKWTIYPNGAVDLYIYRPGDILVAHVAVINDDSDIWTFEEDITLFMNASGELAGIYNVPVNKLDWVESSREDLPTISSNEQVNTDLLCVRHVDALIRPIVALLTATKEKLPDRANNDDYDAYRERIIQPAIMQAKAWLQPLYDIALPDPEIVYCHSRVQYTESPDTPLATPEHRAIRVLPYLCWVLEDDTYGSENPYYTVVKGTQAVPVESDRTAIHAFLLLQRHPEMGVYEAVAKAVRSRSYRPEAKYNSTESWQL